MRLPLTCAVAAIAACCCSAVQLSERGAMVAPPTPTPGEVRDNLLRAALATALAEGSEESVTRNLALYAPSPDGDLGDGQLEVPLPVVIELRSGGNGAIAAQISGIFGSTRSRDGYVVDAVRLFLTKLIYSATLAVFAPHRHGHCISELWDVQRETIRKIYDSPTYARVFEVSGSSESGSPVSSICIEVIEIAEIMAVKFDNLIRELSGKLERIRKVIENESTATGGGGGDENRRHYNERRKLVIEAMKKEADAMSVYVCAERVLFVKSYIRSLQFAATLIRDVTKVELLGLCIRASAGFYPNLCFQYIAAGKSCQRVMGSFFAPLSVVDIMSKIHSYRMADSHQRVAGDGSNAAERSAATGAGRIPFDLGMRELFLKYYNRGGGVATREERNQMNLLVRWAEERYAEEWGAAAQTAAAFLLPGGHEEPREAGAEERAASARVQVSKKKAFYKEKKKEKKSEKQRGKEAPVVAAADASYESRELGRDRDECEGEDHDVSGFREVPRRVVRRVEAAAERRRARSQEERLYKFLKDVGLDAQESVLEWMPRNYARFFAGLVARKGAVSPLVARKDLFSHDISEVLGLMLGPRRREFFYVYELHPTGSSEKRYGGRTFYGGALLEMMETATATVRGNGPLKTDFAGFVEIGLSIVPEARTGKYSVWHLRFSSLIVPTLKIPGGGGAYSGAETQKILVAGSPDLLGRKCLGYEDRSGNKVYEFYDRPNALSRRLTIYHRKNLVNCDTRLEILRGIEIYRSMQNKASATVASNESGAAVAARDGEDSS